MNFKQCELRGSYKVDYGLKVRLFVVDFVYIFMLSFAFGLKLGLES